MLMLLQPNGLDTLQAVNAFAKIILSMQGAGPCGDAAIPQSYLLVIGLIDAVKAVRIVIAIDLAYL